MAASQGAELVEVAEAVEKGGGPAVASAGGLAGLGDPHRLAWRVHVAETGIELFNRAGAAKPVFGERCVWSCAALTTHGSATPLGDAAIEVIGEDIDGIWACGGKKFF